MTFSVFKKGVDEKNFAKNKKSSVPHGVINDHFLIISIQVVV